MKPHGVLETCVYATDLQAAERFYSEVLCLEVLSREPGRHVFFRCGQGVFLVFNPERTESTDGDVAAHGARGAVHVAFAVSETELPGWREQLATHAVAIEMEVAWPRGGHSIYFRDPAANCIELATPRLWGLAEESARF